MTFQEALKILNIEDYADRIYNSNSHGELFHIFDYIVMAQMPGDLSWFRGWFVWMVEQAERKWERPESVFQHIGKILVAQLEAWSKE